MNENNYSIGWSKYYIDCTTDMAMSKIVIEPILSYINSFITTFSVTIYELRRTEQISQRFYRIMVIFNMSAYIGR